MNDEQRQRTEAILARSYELMEETDRLLARASARRDVSASAAYPLSWLCCFRHACLMRLEGIVSKRIGSRYVSGRTRAW